jgi:Ni/Co efflux regulator RcnB
MKMILSTVVAALVAISFATIVFAEDAPYSEHRDTAPAEIRRDEPRRDEVKPMEKQNKRKKHHKQKKHKKQIIEEEQHHQ